jgi:phosphoadenosine phosphosulfate reductase
MATMEARSTVTNHEKRAVTFVKKRLASGEVCRKCLDADVFIASRGLGEHITRTVWADEADPASEGWELARRHRVEVAPFFIVEDGAVEVLTSVVAFARRMAEPVADVPLRAPSPEASPLEIVDWALGRWGADCAIAFSGAEDVTLIDLAHRTSRPFSVFVLDTGRLHPETLAYIDRVRLHYGLKIEIFVPEAEALQAFVSSKGLMSFLEDGHHACCHIRKVEPLARALSGRKAWMTGLRADQSPSTRADLPSVEPDHKHGSPERPLMKVNPLVRWTSAEVWRYLRDREVPFNPLHLQGYRSIGCAPCTRPVHPGEHEREGRWWWEDATRRECGLHLK